MPYLDSWQKRLTKREAKVIIILFAALLIMLEYILFLGAKRERNLQASLDYLNKAELLDEENLNSNKAKFIEALLREPGNAIYHQRLGSIYVKLADTQKAEREFNNAVFLDPRNIRLRLYLAQYFFSIANQEPGLFHLNKAVSLYKTLPHGPIYNEVEGFVKSAGYEELLKK